MSILQGRGQLWTLIGPREGESIHDGAHPVRTFQKTLPPTALKWELPLRRRQEEERPEGRHPQSKRRPQPTRSVTADLPSRFWNQTVLSVQGSQGLAKFSSKAGEELTPLSKRWRVRGETRSRSLWSRPLDSACHQSDGAKIPPGTPLTLATAWTGERNLTPFDL